MPWPAVSCSIGMENLPVNNGEMIAPVPAIEKGRPNAAPF
jgi:hypothetical protein